ncbi:MAG: peptidoglycan-binding protein, partial [Candidatus Sericytochromatia bacterium]
LQQMLFQLGHSQLKLSGRFDKATAHAVKAFQMKYKLPISGLVERKTRDRLNGILAKMLEKGTLVPGQIASGTPESTAATETEAATPAGDLPAPPEADTLVARLGEAGRPGVYSSGSQVELLQRILRHAGYDKLQLNGQFDKATFAAVRNFQLRQKLTISGLVDEATQQVLNQILADIRRIEQHQEVWQDLLLAFSASYAPERSVPALLQPDTLLQLLIAPDPEADAAWPPGPEGLVTATLGTQGQAGIVSQGSMVQTAQALLQFLGYELKLNAQFDLQTFGAMKRFQQDHGLADSGQTDAATRDRLNQYLQQHLDMHLLAQSLNTCLEALAQSKGLQLDSEGLAACAERIRQGILQLLQPEPESESGGPLQWQSQLGPAGRAGCVAEGAEVEQLQQILARLGLGVALTGSYDAATQAAVKKFQLQQRLPLTGIVDTRTREQLLAP